MGFGNISPPLCPEGVVFWSWSLDPAKTDLQANYPPDYIDRVKTVHETGGYGSIGYRYTWDSSEAAKNLLRTHTTAVSARMLYKLAQEASYHTLYCCCFVMSMSISLLLIL